METCAKRLRVPAISLLLAALVLLPSHIAVKASNPIGATYCTTDSSQLLWFLHASDLHIGMSDTTDTTRLQWLVTTARSVINPSFIVATGDLTDSTNGNWLEWPNGPYQAEWDQYKAIVDGAGMPGNFFFDLPGNHDAYNDADFSYYLANSVQGRATGRTQHSWTRFLGTRKYHFLGINSSDNTGDGFSIFWPYGDHAGLDTGELAFINSELSTHADADLTFVFGHHPISDTGVSTDTWLFYGYQEFIDALGSRATSAYNFGHTHRNSQALFTGDPRTGPMAGDGVHYYNVASLGKDSPNSYDVIAIDCDGVSVATKNVQSWPVVLITAPVDKYVSGNVVNPYAYAVPPATSNPIRALVFNPTPVTQVSYRIDGSTTWFTMTQVAANPALWEAAWNASALTGDHTIEVQAVGTSTVSDVITVNVEAGPGNRAPVAANDTYAAFSGQTLNVAAPGVLANDSDPDGDTLSAERVSGPYHGSITLISDGSFTYTPAAGYAGADSFIYNVSDGLLRSGSATVSITVTEPDVVTIVSATYNTRKKQLSVTAKSSVQPNATLTVVNYGQMTYKTKTKTYVLTATAATKPAAVTVTSSRGGSATVTNF